MFKVIYFWHGLVKNPFLHLQIFHAQNYILFKILASNFLKKYIPIKKSVF